MSKQTETGGPAFPGGFLGDDDIVHPLYEGMTLRDYFAAEELSKTDGCAICDTHGAYARLADHCYRMADAMLEARKK